MRKISKLLLMCLLSISILSCNAFKSKDLEKCKADLDSYVLHYVDSIKKIQNNKALEIIDFETDIIDPRDNQTYHLIKFKGINKLWMTDYLNFKTPDCLEESDTARNGTIPRTYYAPYDFGNAILKGWRLYSKDDIKQLDSLLKKNGLNNTAIFSQSDSLPNTNKLKLSFLPITYHDILNYEGRKVYYDEVSEQGILDLELPLTDIKEITLKNEEKDFIVKSLAESGDFEGAKSIRDNVPSEYTENIQESVKIRIFNKKDFFLSIIGTIDDFVNRFLEKSKYHPSLKSDIILYLGREEYSPIWNDNIKNEGLSFKIEFISEGLGRRNLYFPLKIIKDYSDTTYIKKNKK